MGTHEEIADVLDGAADVIERDGWFRLGDEPTRDGDGGACVFVALDRAGDRDLRGYLALSRSLGLDTVLTTAWNDAPERTKQEVLDALRLAAKSERRLADGIDL